MPEETEQTGKQAGAAREPLLFRMIFLVQRGWRPAGTVVAVGLAVLLIWHAFTGRHGLAVWRQTQAEDRALQHEIQSVQQQNEQLRNQIQRLQSDPDAIEREAREKLHYAKPGEVIYTLPEAPGSQSQPAAR